LECLCLIPLIVVFPPRAFWHSGVAERAADDPGDVFSPRFAISLNDRIVTAGSCFAQHVGRTLRENGFNVLDAEPVSSAIEPTLAAKYGLGLFSARYGNIYTTRQLLQLYREALGEFCPAEPIWEKDGRYFDAQRPNCEPGGFESKDFLRQSRGDHLQKVRDVFARADVFVFTLVLTEAWFHRETGTVFPTAPGTIAGQYDPDIYEFRNLGYNEVLEDFLTFREMLMAANPDIRFVVTVSPVPLTATASGQHVEVATARSKAVLRAVCAGLYEAFENVDYFPSFEIITSQRAGGGHYGANLRSVTNEGVQTAMSVFLGAFGYALERPDARVGRLSDQDQDGAQWVDVSKLKPRDLRLMLNAKIAEREEKKSPKGRGRKQSGDRVSGEGLHRGRGMASSRNSQRDSGQDDNCEDALLEAFRK